MSPWVSKTVWDGDPAPPSTLKCTGTGHRAGKEQGAGQARMVLSILCNPLVFKGLQSKASQTLNQLKVHFWDPSSLSPLDCAVSLSREGE